MLCIATYFKKKPAPEQTWEYKFFALIFQENKEKTTKAITTTQARYCKQSPMVQN